MTHEELQAIKARAEAATPGPWEATPSQTVRIDIAGPALGHCLEDDGRVVAYVCEPDAEFIAHARTDVPALVAEVERLREALASQNDARDKIEDEWRDRYESERRRANEFSGKFKRLHAGLADLEVEWRRETVKPGADDVAANAYDMCADQIGELVK